jgi:DNA-binding NarL/FixJ family response regulator
MAARLLPDVLVLDISMPALDGIQAATHIIEINPSLKIVFLTVDRDSDRCRASMATKACRYVLKPRLASDLIPAIELARNGRRFVSPGCD